MAKSRTIGSVQKIIKTVVEDGEEKQKESLILILNPGIRLSVDGENVNPSEKYGTTLLNLFDAQENAKFLLEKGHIQQEEYDTKLERINQKNISKNVTVFLD